MQYSNAVQGQCTIFQTQAHVFIGNAPLFHFMLSKIVFCGVRKQKVNFLQENWHYHMTSSLGVK